MKTKQNYYLFLLVPAVCCLFWACNGNAPSRKVAATVNGEKIYLEEYEKRLSFQKGILSPGTFRDSRNKQDLLKEELLDALITEKIMLQRAAELKLAVDGKELEKHIMDIRKDYGQDFFNLLSSSKVRYEDWEEQIRREMLIGKLIAADVYARVGVTDAELEDFYNENPNFCKTEASVRAFQIVVRDARKAAEVKSRLDQGEDFGKVAKDVSIGPEAARGGDLGVIARQTLPDPLDKTVFALPAGKISEVVKSDYGYHILKAAQKYPAQTRNFEACKEDIRAAVRAQKEETAFGVWLEGLKLKAVVKKEPQAGTTKK